MGTISQSKFMASRSSVCMWAVCFFLFMLNCFMHILTRDWFLVPFEILITVAYVYTVLRLIYCPIIQINNDNIEFIHGLIFPCKVIEFGNILRIERNGANKCKIILKSGKTIRLQFRLVQKLERDVVIAEINKALRNSRTPNSESINTGDAVKEGSWL